MLDSDWSDSSFDAVLFLNSTLLLSGTDCCYGDIDHRRYDINVQYSGHYEAHVHLSSVM